jgi:prolipoprotein diacylglyceryltransferase
MSIYAFIPSPSSNGFDIGPFFFHAYGIAYVFAVAAAILLTRWRWVRVGGTPGLIAEAALWGFPAGLIGGRIYFLITTPSQIPPHWWGPFAIWQGGLGIWSGIAGGVAGGFYLLRKRKGMAWPEIMRLLDVAAPGLLIAQAIEDRQLLQPGAVRQADNAAVGAANRFGAPPARLRPLRHVSAHVPLRSHLEPVSRRVPDRARRTRRITPPGLFALYVAGYSAFRIFEESVRIDYSVYILGMSAELLDRAGRDVERFGLVPRSPAPARRV